MRSWTRCAPPDDCAARIYDPLRPTGDLTAAWAVLDAHHNRYRVAVAPETGVSAGDVAVVPRVAAGDGSGALLGGAAGTIAFAALGGQLVGSWAPGEERFVQVALSGYAGSGAVVLALETWVEP